MFCWVHGKQNIFSWWVEYVAASALNTSCEVIWHAQKVWNGHATTSPNWHLANSAHHWNCRLSISYTNCKRGREQSAQTLCCHEIMKQSQQRLIIIGYGFWNTTETNKKHSKSAANWANKLHNQQLNAQHTINVILQWRLASCNCTITFPKETYNTLTYQNSVRFTAQILVFEFIRKLCYG